MGTAFDMELIKEQMGIIPRAIQDLFRGIEERGRTSRAQGLIPPEFKVVAQFMELYNEEIIDLFDPARDAYGSKVDTSISFQQLTNNLISYEWLFFF